MTGSPAYPDLDHWLDRATDGVPRRWAASIRAELTAHFEDTAADLLEEGAPPETAHQRALAALGDPRAVARGFNDVYRGRHHYLAAALAGVLLIVETFDLPQRFLMPDWAGDSAPSRIFYAVDHSLTALLIFYFVFMIGRLMVWRFGIDALETPVRIALGGIVINVMGTVILDLTVDTSTAIPTVLNASHLAEGLGVLLKDGGAVIGSAGIILMGARSLLAMGIRAAAIAVSAMLVGMVAPLYLVTSYLDDRGSLSVYLIFVLTSLILLSALTLVFLRAWITYRRAPVRTA